MTGGPATARELAALLPIARPGASRYLRVLREAELVEACCEAQRRVYSLCHEPFAQVEERLGRYRALRAAGSGLMPRTPGITRTRHERKRRSNR